MAAVDHDHDHGLAHEKAVEHTAPWLQVPSRAISVVEHPCLIKNIDKGIVSLGGPVKLSKVRSPPSRTASPWLAADTTLRA